MPDMQGCVTGGTEPRRLPNGYSVTLLTSSFVHPPQQGVFMAVATTCSGSARSCRALRLGQIHALPQNMLNRYLMLMKLTSYKPLSWPCCDPCCVPYSLHSVRSCAAQRTCSPRPPCDDVSAPSSCSAPPSSCTSPVAPSVAPLHSVAESWGSMGEVPALLPSLKPVVGTLRHSPRASLGSQGAMGGPSATGNWEPAEPG